MGKAEYIAQVIKLLCSWTKFFSFIYLVLQYLVPLPVESGKLTENVGE
jgi:hypothetical protein